MSEDEVRLDEVPRLPRGAGKAQDSVIAGVCHIKITGAVDGQTGRGAKADLDRGSGAAWKSGDKIPLTDDAVGELAVGSLRTSPE